jgi:hypothetical protein
MKMTYLVILHAGQCEDQQVAGVMLWLEADDKQTPQTIADKFVKDFMDYFKVLFEDVECVCSKCGQQLEEKKVEEWQIIDSAAAALRSFLFSTWDSVGLELQGALEDNGWSFSNTTGGLTYRANRIVTLAGIDRYLEGETIEFAMEDW